MTKRDTLGGWYKETKAENKREGIREIQIQRYRYSGRLVEREKGRELQRGNEKRQTEIVTG